MPAPRWKGIISRTYADIGRNRILALSAGVTFYAILALFPAIAAFVSLYGLFANPVAINSQIQSLAGVMPGGAIEVIEGQISSLTHAGGGSLGLGFAIGLVTALWSANAGSKAIFDALNVVYGEEEKRGFMRLTLTSLAFTCGAIVFLAIILGALIAIPIALKFLDLGGASSWLLWAARWPALLVLVGLVLAVLYRFGPSIGKPKWRWVTPGSALASVVWLGASMLFSWYVSSFGSYNKTYGSLGAAVGFMTWMWISGIIVLIGADINAQSERQSVNETRDEPER